MMAEKHPMIFYGGQFFDKCGVMNISRVKNIVTNEIKDYVEKGLSKQVEALVKAMELLYYQADMDIDINTAKFKNGDFSLIDRNFVPPDGISANRLSVNYNPNAEKPEKWLAFLNELLYEEDIPTLQEYMGYCMIPTNKAQAMLLLIGEGGEGKSIVGQIMEAMFGDSASKLKISTLTGNRFGLSVLENRLLMIEDDMIMSALKDTDKIKEIITCRSKMVMEQKHNPLYEGDVYSRIIAFANGALDALYDKSEGFRRRQIVINVKPRREDRIDNKSLPEEIIADELEGIALWALEGLIRLFEKGFHFTISERTRKNMNNLRKEDNNVISFMESENYLCFGKEETTTTKALYDAYLSWCNDNFYEPFKNKRFEKSVASLSAKYGLTSSNNIKTLEDKNARGYIGVSTRFSPGTILI